MSFKEWCRLQWGEGKPLPDYYKQIQEMEPLDFHNGVKIRVIVDQGGPTGATATTKSW